MKTVAALFAALTSLTFQGDTQGTTPFPVVQGKTYKLERVADGIYYAMGGSGSNMSLL